MNSWERDFDGIPECSWWFEDCGEYCQTFAEYRVRPKGSTVWYVQACYEHLDQSTSLYSDAEIEKYPYYKEMRR